MAVATGTAALIGAGIAAASQTGGAIMQNRANGRALDAEERARREALAYEQQREWRARNDAKQQYDTYMRSVYGDRYQGGGGAKQSFAGGAVAPAPAAAAGAPAVPAENPPVAASGSSLADIGQWHDWSRYTGKPLGSREMTGR